MGQVVSTIISRRHTLPTYLRVLEIASKLHRVAENTSCKHLGIKSSRNPIEGALKALGTSFLRGRLFSLTTLDDDLSLGEDLKGYPIFHHMFAGLRGVMSRKEVTTPPPTAKLSPPFAQRPRNEGSRLFYASISLAFFKCRFALVL